MNSEDLRKLQEPLKAKYKSAPESAVVTLKAKSRIGEGLTCKVETGKALQEAGLHPATGGNGLSACSGDMLLESLAACSGVTLSAVAAAIAFPLKDAVIHVEGDLDFRGTLAVDRDAPVGFKSIRLMFDIKSDEPQARTKKLIELTERYCVVYQTLRNGNKIDVSYK